MCELKWVHNIHSAARDADSWWAAAEVGDIGGDAGAAVAEFIPGNDCQVVYSFLPAVDEKDVDIVVLIWLCL